MLDDARLTIGIDHIGLAVRDVALSRSFFCECLGWRVVGEDRGYPAAFVSDGRGVVTLWQVADLANCVPFDRRGIVGLITSR